VFSWQDVRGIGGPGTGDVACGLLGAAMAEPRGRSSGKWLRLAIVIFTILPLLLLSALIAFQVSPWPSVLLIRRAFNQDAQSVSLALEKHVPPALSAQLNEPYDPADPDALLDVFYPSAIADKPLPTIVWVHGGGWVSGSKDDIANYGKVLAGKGYTVVGVDYSLAPGKTFPTPIRQVNAALGYLVKNAERLRIDPDHLVLAGDSGGAHIAAVTANAVAVPSYAAMLGIVPAVERRQLAALLLYCGTYTIDGINLDGPFGKFLSTVLWSFSGSKDFKSNPNFAAAWVLNHVTAEFPPTFISAGNGDPLLPQSIALADRLASRGVRVERLFFASDRQPPLPHEYQFNLDNEAGRRALERSLAFLARQIRQ
jgi:acetyl esterase